ncbi:MAG: sigma-54-dependent Fis family transcriptional regulator, partial [Acidobacteria bacterium]|nr:sigma-54-dependent Fis family transcriptional regulator [Acidobacteriota bacterium]
GGARDIRVDVRIVAATNRDLQAMVRDGRFREDLYYRLRVLPVELPPLRVRSDDIAELAQLFVQQFRREFLKDVRGVSDEALAKLKAYSWPGNVRELRNAVERAVLLAEGPELGPSDFAIAGAGAQRGGAFDLPETGLDFEDLERTLVRQALERAAYNKARAAKLLGMPRDWLRYRIEKFGLADSHL